MGNHEKWPRYRVIDFHITWWVGHCFTPLSGFTARSNQIDTENAIVSDGKEYSFQYHPDLRHWVSSISSAGLMQYYRGVGCIGDGGHSI